MPSDSPDLRSESVVPWQPSQRYPDPAIQILDQSFARYRVNSASVERIAHGFRWCEGPVWFGDGRYLVWSDIPNNRMLKWEEETGAVSVFRKPSAFANGNTRDRQGRLVTCEHGGRRVSRTEYDGSLTVIADRFEGKRLNSPNDVVVKSDGSIWFTDPPFGLLGNYEGHAANQELPMNVYRVDGASGEITVVESEVNRPNGLCFSPDESILYLVESGSTPRNIYAYDVTELVRTRQALLLLHRPIESCPGNRHCCLFLAPARKRSSSPRWCWRRAPSASSKWSSASPPSTATCSTAYWRFSPFLPITT